MGILESQEINVLFCFFGAVSTSSWAPCCRDCSECGEQWPDCTRYILSLVASGTCSGSERLQIARVAENVLSEQEGLKD